MIDPSQFDRDRRPVDGRENQEQTRTLGLLVGSVDNPFHSSILRAVEDTVASEGYAVFAASLDVDPTREEEIVAGFLARRVDGLIIAPVAASQAYLLSDDLTGTPVVFVDREPTDVEADVVASNNAAGAAQATRHLLLRGHRRIAFLGDRENIRTARERRRGFLEELDNFGAAREDFIVLMDLHDEESAAQATRDLLDSKNPPTALFTGQNLITIGSLTALRARNRERTVALVGFDDVSRANLMVPGITVIAQDPYRIGELAAQRLLARMRGDTSPGQIYDVPTTLILRGSGEIRPRPWS
ncbi:substrate-binding domain-containing protein [Cryobacterium sp. MLB-32]|uniref:substrate-binding domain-containing protein n=1 Tax=Cryobacterium sp. MLB-32 TaxID=1529318 RepID=UPI0006925766|nr:substrate-binding domain-containing protein [Cryobacterium sp. MLB-32]